MKAPPALRTMDSYDTEEEQPDSEDDLLPPDPSVVNTLDSLNPNPPYAVAANDASMSINAPPDKYNIIYVIFFIQGIGMLLPWNFFITANEYFQYKFQEDEAIQGKFENAFSLASMFPNVISLFLNIFLTNKLSRGSRIISCLTVMFITFIVTTVLVKIDSQSWADKFFAITICCVVAINIASGVYQGTLFGVAGIVGQRYIQAIMSGQAMAGVFAALSDLISKLASNDRVSSAFIFFLIATAVILITAVSYTMLFNLPRMQFYFRRFERHANNDSEGRKQHVQVQIQNKPSTPYFLIFKEILPMALSVTLVFCVTLSMFPAVLVKVQSTNKGNKSRWNNKLFPTTVCFLLFNAGDWCGRILAGYYQVASERGFLLPILCVSRIIFVPLILMCNVSGHRFLPYVFKHDYWPVIINSLFAISNGYLGSLCMMFGPKRVAIEYVETAGTIMSLFLSIGLSLGACISFAFS